MSKDEDQIKLVPVANNGSIPPDQENSERTDENQGARKKTKSDERSNEQDEKCMRYLRNKCITDSVWFKVGVFTIQFVKLILISYQAYRFANERSEFSDIVNRGHIALRHLLLKGWDSVMETEPYPPARGEFAVYEIEELKGSINFAVERYFNAENDAIGFYKPIHHKSRNDTITIRISYFDFPEFESSMTELRIEEYSQRVGIGLNATTDPATNKVRYTYNIEELFDLLNLTDPVRRLLTVNLDFTIHSVRVNEGATSLECLFIDGTVSFLDVNSNGQMVVDLITKTNSLRCSDMGYNITILDLAGYNTDQTDYTIAGLMSVVCLFSLVTCFPYTWLLYKEQDIHTLKDKLLHAVREGLLWVVMIVASDLLAMYGVWSKLVWASHRKLSDMDTTAICLGISGLLSYLNIFQFSNQIHWTFRNLRETLSGAFKVMPAYLLTTAGLFFGFVLCGYLILGPYHVKFRTVTTTIETLFSICNGDELFATLANVESSKSGNILAELWISRCFICIYVAVFTIVVINIFISIFVNTYDIIQDLIDVNVTFVYSSKKKAKKQEEHQEGKKQEGNKEGKKQEGNQEGKKQEGNQEGKKQEGNQEGKKQEGNQEGKKQEGNQGV